MSNTQRDLLVNSRTEHKPDQVRFHVIRSEDIVLRPFPAFPPAARLAILVGDTARTESLSRSRIQGLRALSEASGGSDIYRDLGCLGDEVI
jgi:hypothetical protein